MNQPVRDRLRLLDPGRVLLWTALRTILAALAALLITVAMCRAADLPGGIVVIATVVAVMVSRTLHATSLAHRLSALLYVPVIGLLAAYVGRFMLHHTWWGAAMYVAAVGAARYLLRFGGKLRRFGRLAFTPLIAVMVVPLPPNAAKATGPVWAAVAGATAVLCVLLSQALLPARPTREAATAALDLIPAAHRLRTLPPATRRHTRAARTLHRAALTTEDRLDAAALPPSAPLTALSTAVLHAEVLATIPGPVPGGAAGGALRASRVARGGRARWLLSASRVAVGGAVPGARRLARPAPGGGVPGGAAGPALPASYPGQAGALPGRDAAEAMAGPALYGGGAGSPLAAGVLPAAADGAAGFEAGAALPGRGAAGVPPGAPSPVAGARTGADLPGGVAVEPPPQGAQPAVAKGAAEPVPSAGLSADTAAADVPDAALATALAEVETAAAAVRALPARARPAKEPPRAPARKGLQPHTRLSAQLTVAMAAAFAVGHLLFPHHWTWTVITAFVVCSAARARGDVVHRSGLRIAGAFTGAVTGTLVAHLVADVPTAAVAVIFCYLFVGVWLREVSYAVWAFCVTSLLAVLYSLNGEQGTALLLQRPEGILAGSACGVLAAYFVLPLRTETLMRGRAARALQVLQDLLAAVREPDPEPAALRRLVRALDRAARDLGDAAASARAHRALFARRATPHAADWADTLAVCVREARALAATPPPDLAAARNHLALTARNLGQVRRRLGHRPDAEPPRLPATAAPPHLHRLNTALTDLYHQLPLPTAA